ncbi:hypothetical protein SAMN05216480_103133 [Pustulibacterium marinum]|uniref:Uncharacterized protein n=1 Tax=Pustulibacterium marinum TaxID=1224947 RepID=A0A1I7G3K9_9FLAO|nr:hypothetical protein [Pustulibacterium marinum]SFU43028.1 hypothetical protein SAMN05216480_103133 [Pustulibacterium marinum]
MRPFFSLSTVAITAFCIANIWFPLGSISIIFCIVAIVFAVVLFRLSKTAFKKNLPKVLIGINIILIGVFLLKPVLFKDEVQVDETVVEQRKELQIEAQDQLNTLEEEGVLDQLEELNETTIDSTDEADTETPQFESEAVEFEQPTFQ